MGESETVVPCAARSCYFLNIRDHKRNSRRSASRKHTAMYLDVTHPNFFIMFDLSVLSISHVLNEQGTGCECLKLIRVKRESYHMKEHLLFRL